MKVLLQLEGCLWLELSEAVLTYLRTVVDHQVAVHSDLPMPDRRSSVKGISFDTQRQAFRVKFTHSGSEKQKYFAIKKGGEEEAMEKAMAFLQYQQQQAAFA